MTINANPQIPFQAMPGLQHQTLAGSDEGLKHLSVWRQNMAPGAATPPHRHDCEEVVLVASGSGEVHMQGKVLRFGPDSTLVIPPNVDHQIFNTGSEPMMMVAAFVMGGWLGKSLAGVVQGQGSVLPLTNGIWFWSVAISATAWTLVQRYGQTTTPARREAAAVSASS